MADLVEVSRRLRENVERIEERIATACTRSGRARGEVQLVPITKYVDAEITGLLHDIVAAPLGESRPQVIWEKAPQLPNATWHLVGHLQRNKVARTLPLVSLIHSVDSQRLLLAIDDEAKKLGKTQDVLLELQLTQEATKSGFEEDEWEKLPGYVSTLKNIRVLGLMGMAALESTTEEARITFAKLRSLRDNWQEQFTEPHQLKHLSIGMTHDFEQAIEEGATLIRVGSALFEGVI
jgi:pyridoxal phosphate enzyme (YggS family)